MAQEIKNTFLKSKMNKDLDDRILPNGEYRDARNISVGRSEDNDVGALENIIGNDLVAGTDLGNGLTIIGIKEDNASDSIFVFLTDYTDPSPNNPTNAPASSKHYIYVYNAESNQYTRLVQGNFLNFSTTNRIIGINLLENLLFWTDNRNQPRKINVNLAASSGFGAIGQASSYYTQEHQISVAKYNPYRAIELYNRADLQVIAGATTTVFQIEGHRRAELVGFIGATVVCSEATPSTQGTDYVKVVSIFDSLATPNVTTITVSPALNSAPSANDFVSLIGSTMSNKKTDDTWPGDPDYLEDKFVRFSYRFKFDDNEYSLMAPFTQIAYIPKQNGFFVHGDEESAYRATIVDFMENLVQNIELVIPLPSSANRLIKDYKISELEILFRESNSIAAKVLTTVDAGTIAGESGISNYYTYEYQSRKPYRTLPETQTVRVYDKVPTRALTQEISGNRIIYGNYVDKHTPPKNIDYNCRIDSKSSTGAFNNWIEYPNHSVKRNRNYQVGFVLADKFGRKSPVILSSVDAGIEENGLFYAGSTIYSPYDTESTDTNVLDWFGDVIQVLVNQPIESETNLISGTPGLYAIKNQYAPNTGEGFAITDGFAQAGVSPITDTTWTFTLDVSNYPNNANVPQVGNSLRGAYEDFVVVTDIVGPNPANTYTVTTTGRVNDVYLREINIPSNTPDLKFAYTINDLGWYSYQIVVKQTEQDYYNVYLPGILNGYPGQTNEGDANGPFPNNEINLTAHTVLFNDNINKVPRDLKEVGEQDKQFRSSVELYGRVSNLMHATSNNNPEDANPGNKQYYPRLDYTGKNAIKHTATTVSTASELDMSYKELSASTGQSYGGRDGNLVFYQIDSNPLIARIATNEKAIGWDAERIPNPTLVTEYEWNMQPYLAIYETAPMESLLDIYWETSSDGLIVDLNAAVAASNTGVTGFENITWDFKEDITSGTSVTGWFSPVDNQGLPFVTRTRGILTSVKNGLNELDTTSFELEEGPVGSSEEGNFRINYIGDGIVYVQGSEVKDVYSFVIECTTDNNTGITSSIPLAGVSEGFGALLNLQPQFNQISQIVSTPTTRVLISESSWEATNFFNGSVVNDTAGSTGLNKKSQLEFSFEGIGATTEIPDNWEMNSVTGELTQWANLGGPDSFTGNPFGIYRIRVKLTDSNGGASSPTADPEGYAPLAVTQDIEIRLEPSAVNDGAKTDSDKCMLTPPPITGLPTVTNQGVFGQWQKQRSVGCVYYISDRNLNPNGDGDNSAFFPNKGMGNNAGSGNAYYYKIGNNDHKSGTISFTINTYCPYNDDGLDGVSAFKMPWAQFYYRQPTADNPNPQWIPLPRSAEMNQVGHLESGYSPSNQLAAPSGRDPYNADALFNDQVGNDPTSNQYVIGNYRVLDTSVVPPEFINYEGVKRVISDRGPDPVWVQTVRAFNFDELFIPEFSAGALNGIEYAISVQDQVQYTGLNNDIVRSWVIADDLNYPRCAPWQGVNAVEANGGQGLLFRYTKSPGNNDASAFVSTSEEVWGRNPYGDYLNELYTGQSNYVPLIPNLGENYINLKIDRNLATPLASWTNLPFTNLFGQGNNASNENLQFVVGLSATNGKKLLNSNISSGVGAKRTFSGTNSIAGMGTIRISKN
jgi:hypothetical protein